MQFCTLTLVTPVIAQLIAGVIIDVANATVGDATAMSEQRYICWAGRGVSSWLGYLRAVHCTHYKCPLKCCHMLRYACLITDAAGLGHALADQALPG